MLNDQSQHLSTFLSITRLSPAVMKVLLGIILLLAVICLLVQSFVLCVIHE